MTSTTQNDLIKPLSPRELEDIQCKSEMESVGIYDVTKPEEEVKRLAGYVLALCVEIKRLRYTYGEEWWQPVNKTDQDIEEERKRYREAACLKYEKTL